MKKLSEKEYNEVLDKIEKKFNFKISEVNKYQIFNANKVYEIDDENCGSEKYQSIINKILVKTVNNDMYAIDYQHEGFIYNPNENITLQDSGWLDTEGVYSGFPCYYPNGDYFFFVSLDFTQALLCVPGFGLEKSLMFVVGEELIKELDMNKKELLLK